VPFWRSHHPEEEDGDLRLVVGLGNPGAQYERTRHNVGFMATNALAQRGGGTFRSSKHRADVCRVTIDGVPLILAQPTTFMNDSGSAVSRLLAYYHVPLPRLLIVCDDIELPFGTLRLRPSGSSGGNNGLKSIIAALGTQDFARLRIGVGRGRGDAMRHVLGTFPPEEARLLPALLQIAGDAVLYALQRGVLPAMNEYNRDWLPELESIPEK
jgi:peptidyl-tRNA hydrolase, PTH1 family